MLKLSRLSLLVAGTLLVFASVGCNSSKESQDNAHILSNTDSFKTEMDTVSYILGTNIYRNFNQQDFGTNDTMILKGLSDAIQGKDTLFSQSQEQQIMRKFQQKLRAQQQGQQQQRGNQQNQAQAKINKQEAEQFLAKNKEKAGVKTTESGLQYKVLEKGDGASPKLSDKVRVHYEGKTIDGTIFDSSYERGQPAEFPLNGVIKGWQEGLQLMKEGAKYKLFIPPGLGYGPRGQGPDIGPNELLIFEVELLEVK